MNPLPRKKPFVKATQEQIQDRVEFVYAIISANPLVRTSVIKDAVFKQFGVEYRQCEEYLSRARDLMRKRSTMPKEEAKDIVVNGLVREMGAGKHVVQAADTLCRIYGLFAPTKTEISGPEGGTIKVEDKTKKEIDYDGLSKVARELFGISSADGDGQSVRGAHTNGEAGAVPEHNGH